MASSSSQKLVAPEIQGVSLADPVHDLQECPECTSQNDVLKDKYTVKRCLKLNCMKRNYSVLEIELYNWNVPQLQELYDFLSKNKEAISYIRNLTLSGSTDSNKFKKDTELVITFLDFLLTELIQVENETRKACEQFGAALGGSISTLPGLLFLDITKFYWTYLGKNSRNLVAELIKSVSKLQTIALPICDRNDGHYCIKKSKYLLNISGSIRSLRHLHLRSLYLDCETLDEMPYVPKKMVPISIQSLQIMHFSKFLKEHLLYPESPFDYSDLEEICIGGVEEIWKGDVLTDMVRLNHKSLKSIIWLVGMQWQNIGLQICIDADKKPISGPLYGEVKVYLRRLTIAAERNSDFEFQLPLAKEFSLLRSQFGVCGDELQELNLAYPIEDCEIPVEDSVAQTLVRADEELKSLCAQYHFPNLQEINLFVGFDKRNFEEWVTLVQSKPNNFSRLGHWYYPDEKFLPLCQANFLDSTMKITLRVGLKQRGKGLMEFASITGRPIDTISNH